MTASAKSRPLAVLCLAIALSSGGCQHLPPALRGGTASSTLAGLKSPPKVAETAASVQQPDNPAATSTQTVERQETRQEAAPLPSVRTTVREYPPTPENPAGVKITTVDQFGPPTVLTHTVNERTGTTLGAAQKDTAREVAAKLNSFAGIRWAGLGFLAFALACFHPVVRAVIGGGKTIPALAALAGIVCIFGPALFVGHETLVLCLVAAGLAAAYLLVRLSHKEGQADALKTSLPPPAGSSGRSRPDSSSS